VLRASDASFAYVPGRDVLRGVSVAFHAGRVAGIIGPNAGGKTTLLRLLAGLRTPTNGSVTVGDAALTDFSATQRARRLVFVPQHAEVAFAFSTREVVELGSFAAGGQSRMMADQALAEVRLSDRAEAAFSTLSAGQQQRATLARALVQLEAWSDATGAHEPRFLLADEPVSAMDPRHALSSLETLRGLASRGIGVVCVLHDLSLALRFCDQVVMLGEGGRVLAAGPTRETMTAERLSELYGVGFEPMRDTNGDIAGFVPMQGE
jgi:iron complex transport system ATP-binding protein